MNDLSIYNFKINTYEMKANPDSIIKELINDYSPEDAILGLFIKFRILPNSTSTFQERYNYFYNLVAQVKKISEYDYTEDDLKIYALYITSTYPMSSKTSEELKNTTLRLETIFNLKASGQNEKWAKECVKYKLLHLYSEQISSGRYEDMKVLLDNLNGSREYFESLQNTILEKIK